LEDIDAQKATGLAVYKDGKEADAPFPVDNNNFSYEPSARSFHNGRFVQQLRRKAFSLSKYVKRILLCSQIFIVIDLVYIVIDLLYSMENHEYV